MLGSDQDAIHPMWIHPGHKDAIVKALKRETETGRFAVLQLAFQKSNLASLVSEANNSQNETCHAQAPMKHS